MDFDITALRREARGSLRLAVPVVFSYLGVFLMGTVDTMMLGRVTPTAMAAGALGSNVFFTLTILPMGIVGCVEPLVAQAFGADDRKAIARHLQQGLVLAVTLAIPVSLMMLDLEQVLLWTGQPSELAAGGATYLLWVIPSVLATLLYMALRGFLQSIHVVQPLVWTVVAANLINILANWVLVFGNWGFPALGLVGSAVATSISRWLMLLLLVMAVMPELRRYLATRYPDLWRLRAYRVPLGIGIPMGIHRSMEMWLFAAVALAMGTFGAIELAGHQVSLQLSGIAFMVPMAVGAAATTRVGNAIGRQDMTGARYAAVVNLVFGVGFMTMTALLFFSVPRFLSRFFTPDPEVVAMAAMLLQVAAVFQVFDGLQVVAGGVLRGAADTKVPALIAFLGYWGLGLPLGLILAFVLDWGPRGLWWGLTLGLASVALLLLERSIRLFRGVIVAVEASPG